MAKITKMGQKRINKTWNIPVKKGTYIAKIMSKKLSKTEKKKRLAQSKTAAGRAALKKDKERRLAKLSKSILKNDPKKLQGTKPLTSLTQAQNHLKAQEVVRKAKLQKSVDRVADELAPLLKGVRTFRDLNNRLKNNSAALEERKAAYISRAKSGYTGLSSSSPSWKNRKKIGTSIDISASRLPGKYDGSSSVKKHKEQLDKVLAEYKERRDIRKAYLIGRAKAVVKKGAEMGLIKKDGKIWEYNESDIKTQAVLNSLLRHIYSKSLFDWRDWWNRKGKNL